MDRVEAISQRPPACVQQGVVSNLQERCTIACRAALSTMTNMWNMIGFFAFRVLEFFSPTLGPRLEVLYLRVGNVWTAMKAAWREEEVAKRMQELEAENRRLREQVKDLESCRTVIRDGAAAVLAARAQKPIGENP